MNKRKRTAPKLVFLMIGFCLSLLVSLPVFAWPYTDLGNGIISIDGAQYHKCPHCSHTEIMKICHAMNWGSEHAIPYISSWNRPDVCACICLSVTPNQR